MPESINSILEVKLTEAMTVPVPEEDHGRFGPDSVEDVVQAIADRDAVVIGPGLGRKDKTLAFTLELFTHLKRPSLVDADALFAASTDLSVLKKCEAPLVLTPHPGEMAQLSGTTVDEVQSNRLETARSFAQEHEVVLVLKGARTVIGLPGGDAYVNTTGTHAMASGGMGDVLSGVIGGLMAQGVEPALAAVAGVYIHGRAGELACETRGGSSVLASDVADALHKASNEFVQQA